MRQQRQRNKKTRSGFASELDIKLEETLEKLRQAGIDIDSSDVDVTKSLYIEFKNEKRARASLDQIDREKDYIRKYKSCHGNDTNTRDWINSRLGNINMEEFQQMLTGDFFDNETMNAMVCVSSAAYLASSSSLAPNDRIRSWFRNLRQIGTESVAGYAILTDAGSGIDEQSSAKGAFIVKAVRDSSRGSELVHEVFCAMAGLNRLRKMVPNFAYVFGFAECSAPVGSTKTPNNPKGKKINTFCNTQGRDNDVVMAIYENISPAKDFGTLIREGLNGEDFMRYYIALLMAEHVAMVECDFTHYDEHQENVLMRECTDSRYLESVASGGDNLFYVPYTLKLANGDTAKYYVISSGRIPTIIDYGRSHVKVDGRNYGMPGEDSYLYIQQNVFRDRSNPLYDAFKLLGMALSEALDSGNNDLVGEIAPLLRHFQLTEFDINKISEYRSLSKNYMLPINSNLEDLEKYIGLCLDYCNAMDWFAVVDEPPEGSFILTPVSDRLQIDVLRKVGLDENLVAIPQPHTFLELYDVLSKHALMLKGFKESIDSSGTSEQTNRHWQSKINETSDIFRQIRQDFIRTDKDGYSQLDIAYDFALKRMKEVCEDFMDANMYEFNFGGEIESLEDVSGYISQSASILNTPSNINTYFEETTLESCRVYVSRVAAFAEMRDTLTTLDKALEYIKKVYKSTPKKERDEMAINKIEALHNYIHTFLHEIQPISQKYYDSLINFINVFTEPTEGSSKKAIENYQRWKGKIEYDDFEQYAWYFNVVRTVPSLFRS